ncbi:hypothetical protein EUGRSUZ_G00273 [Eucalyptus grandis]|uniref:Uncharacterized protein n=2 Tax=Eucalyptus grandis TaxID=71139 RepID=A0ACC3K297_EUCGR|nr:hypothetical protein EUGRSUZ_G00273 [Eucalyptus grandis]
MQLSWFPCGKIWQRSDEEHKHYIPNRRTHGDNIENDIGQWLIFCTNRRRHGPFGKKRGNYFGYPSIGSKMIGFYGRCRETLKSIGVYVQPIPHLYHLKTIRPFGGSSGPPWDDGVHTDVRGLYGVANNIIRSIGIVYDSNGPVFECPRHGGEDESPGIWVSPYLTISLSFVFLNYPKERLVSISGRMNGNGNTCYTTMHNLKIHTKKTTYGPYRLPAGSMNTCKKC